MTPGTLMPHFARAFFLVASLSFTGTVTTASGETAESPFRLAPGREAVIILTGAALSLAGHHAESNVTPPGTRTLSRSDVPGFDRISLDLHAVDDGYTDDIVYAACAGLPLVAAGTVSRSGGYRGAATILAMYAESLLLANSATTIAKGTFHRTRPYAYSPDVTTATLSDRETALSFWSGHTTIAFNGAVFAGAVFQAYNPESRFIKPVWAIGLATATTTGILRIRRGEHFPTDVLAGAAAGSLTGWLVPRLHRTGVTERHSVMITPMTNGPRGIRVSRAF